MIKMKVFQRYRIFRSITSIYMYLDVFIIYSVKVTVLNKRFFPISSGLSIKDDYVDLPSLYWIPKLGKCPYNEL